MPDADIQALAPKRPSILAPFGGRPKPARASESAEGAARAAELLRRIERRADPDPDRDAAEAIKRHFSGYTGEPPDPHEWLDEAEVLRRLGLPPTVARGLWNLAGMRGVKYRGGHPDSPTFGGGQYRADQVERLERRLELEAARELEAADWVVVDPLLARIMVGDPRRVLDGWKAMGVRIRRRKVGAFHMGPTEACGFDLHRLVGQETGSPRGTLYRRWVEESDEATRDMLPPPAPVAVCGPCGAPIAAEADVVRVKLNRPGFDVRRVVLCQACAARVAAALAPAAAPAT